MYKMVVNVPGVQEEFRYNDRDYALKLWLCWAALIDRLGSGSGSADLYEWDGEKYVLMMHAD